MPSTRLFWSRSGEVACEHHRPDHTSRAWILQRWAQIPIDVRHSMRYQCQHCLDSPLRHQPRMAPSGRTHPLVLNVESDDTRRNRRARQLRREGFFVVNAATRERAIALARDQRPDLLVVGASLPGLSGDALCTRLKAHPLLVGVPTVLMGPTLDEVSVQADACLLDEPGRRIGHVLRALLSLPDSE
jgi:CheY-like chemotaxis protein